MQTIGEIAKRFNLSRSTLLYYDKLGLLKPEKRQNNNYRLYDDEQVKRLEKIILFRSSGISLKEIKNILDLSTSKLSNILQKRLDEIQTEIESLKKQQALVVDVLKEEVIHDKNVAFSAETWTELLKKLGYDESTTLSWHRQFEDENPKMHLQFLESLNLSEEKINKLLLLIRRT